ncbi:MAG: MvaI/BcnI family restriction endonuclease [Hyphomonadaceae bacterium]
MRKLTGDERESLAALTSYGVDSALIEVTETGLHKSIMDATRPVRELLLGYKLHDYDSQAQGTDFKVTLPAIVFSGGQDRDAKASLYRPQTKQGDPRIWFYGLKAQANPFDVLAIAPNAGTLLLINLTQLAASHIKTGRLGAILSAMSRPAGSASEELLERLQVLAKTGPVKSVMAGRSDTAIGRTLEAALGIAMNSSKSPDYKGIELKASRRRKAARAVRKTLFAQVPDWSRSPFKSSAEMLQAFGYNRGKDFKLYCTVNAAKVNSQGLSFDVQAEAGDLWEVSNQAAIDKFAVWSLDKLRERLASKHAETFWVTARPEMVGGQEWYHLDRVLHTRKPVLSQLDPLLDQGVITMDHLIKRTPTGGAKEKGPLFKIAGPDLALLFPPPLEYDLVA